MLEDAARLARAAERLGCDGAWSGEVSHDALLPLAIAAGATSTIELGTGILVAFARTPMAIANAAWDLQRYSNGRLLLGLGTQIKTHIEKRFSMPWSRPVPRMREYVSALHAIWDCWQNNTPLNFRGDFYQHTVMTPMFNPGPLDCGRPRVFLAAVGMAMTKVAGEVADGLLLHSFTTDRYATEVTLPTYEAAVLAAGRDRKSLEVKYSPFIATGANEQEMIRSITDVRRRIAFYGSTPAYRPVLELHGWGELQTELRSMSQKGLWTEMGDLIDDDILRAFAVVAPHEELAGALRVRCRPIADRVSVEVPTETDTALLAEVVEALHGP
jgi:probable F420-dependent oxidoreductase